MYRWAIAAAIATAVSGCDTMHQQDGKVAWDNVPAAAQTTIQAHMYGGWVDRVEFETAKHTRVYAANIKAADGEWSRIIVTADGKLLRYRTCGKTCSEYADY